MIPLLLLTLACSKGADDSASPFSANPPTVLGGERPSEVVIPTAYSPDRSWPLVLLLHGYGANSTLQDAVFGLGPRVDSLGFILVKPEGTTNSDGAQFWNATNECCDFEDTKVDDVGYLSSLIAEAHTLYPLSTVNLVGHSNGGYMSYRMACDRPDLLDRIVVLAGATWKEESMCPGIEPVSVLQVHGTDDDDVAYESNAHHAGARESVGRWVTKAGCDEPSSSLGDRDYLSGQEGAETTIEQWTGCAQGIDVQLWSAEGGSHYFLDNVDAFKDDFATWVVGE